MLVNRDRKVIYANKPDRQIEDLCDSLGWTIETSNYENMDEWRVRFEAAENVPADIVVNLLSGRVDYGRARTRAQRRAAMSKVVAAARRWVRWNRRTA